VQNGLLLHQGHLEGCAERPFVALGPHGRLCRTAFCCTRATWKAVQGGPLLHQGRLGSSAERSVATAQLSSVFRLSTTFCTAFFRVPLRPLRPNSTSSPPLSPLRRCCNASLPISIYYIKNNYMFRPFSLAIFGLINVKLSKQVHLTYVGCMQWGGKVWSGNEISHVV